MGGGFQDRHFREEVTELQGSYSCVLESPHPLARRRAAAQPIRIYKTGEDKLRQI
jgi:hypothetical protein